MLDPVPRDSKIPVSPTAFHCIAGLRNALTAQFGHNFEILILAKGKTVCAYYPDSHFSHTHTTINVVEEKHPPDEIPPEQPLHDPDDPTPTHASNPANPFTSEPP